MRRGSLHARCAAWKESRAVGASAPVGPDSCTRSGGCRLLTSFGHISVCLPFSLPLGQSPSHPPPSRVPRAPLPESPSDRSVSSHPSTPGRAALTERPGPASVALAAAAPRRVSAQLGQALYRRRGRGAPHHAPAAPGDPGDCSSAPIPAASAGRHGHAKSRRV